MTVRIIVCGGRHFNDDVMLSWVLTYVHVRRYIIEVIHGAASGADSLAGQWARQNLATVTPVPADWRTHGRAAGPLRNREMLKLNPDGVVAFPGGRGTADMVAAAKDAGVPVLMAEDLWKKRKS